MNRLIFKPGVNGWLQDLDSSSPKTSSRIFWLFLIVMITVIAYLPALKGEFLNFDDHRIYNQPLITDFNLENFKKIFSTEDAGFHFLVNWLTLLTYQINWLICPHYVGFIVFAVICHLLQTIFFWKICRQFSTALAFTVLATLLFSLHPLHTNHVVWQSARWHLLAITFCLFSAWHYLGSLDENKTRKRRIIRYLLAVLGYFVIAFGRPFYFIYPLTLVVLDFLKQKKFAPILILNKLPFFLFAIINIVHAERSGMMSSRIKPQWLGGSFVNTLLTDGNLDLEYFRQLFIPAHTTLVVPINEATGLFSTSGGADLLFLKIPPVISLVFFMVLFVFFIYLWRGYGLRHPLILLLGIFVTLLAVQNIPARQGLAGVFAYRYAVFSVVFAAPLTALFFIWLYKRLCFSGAYAGIVLCALFGYLFWMVQMTGANVEHFKKSENLWSHHVTMLPNSRAGHYYLGKVYQFQNHDPYRALAEYQIAQQCPHYWGAGGLKQRLVETYLEVGSWEKAQEVLSSIDGKTIAQSKSLTKLKAKIEDHGKTQGISPRQVNLPRSNKKIILFDQVHSVRHSPQSVYTKDSIEYNVVQGYARLQQFLKELGFEVREHRYGRLTAQKLKQVDVLMLGIMSYEALEMTPPEIEAIVDFVQGGGGLHMVCDHTNAYDNAVLANRLLKHFAIEVSDTLVVDKSAPKDSWYTPKSFRAHPVTEGLKVLVHQAGCSLATDYGVAFTDANAWADKGDPNSGISRFGNKVWEPDEKKGALPVVAARTFGQGRIVVTTDCNLYANSWLFSHDNYKLVRNAFSWLAKINPLPIPKAKNDILLHEGYGGYFRVNWHPEAYYSFYVNFGHMDAVRVYLSSELSFDKKAILLFDRINLSENLQGQLFDYVKQGGVLVYLCTEKNYRKYRTALLNRFGIKFGIVSSADADTEYFPVTGDPFICENVFQLPWVPSTKFSGATPVVYGEFDRRKIFVAKKDVGQGAIYVVPFKEIFKTKYMGTGTSSRNPNMREQQIRRLQENLVNEIVANY